MSCRSRYPNRNVPGGTWSNIPGAAVVIPAPGASDQIRAQTRFTLSNAWRTYSSTDPNRARKIGGFRLANNAGDVLSRVNYSCGGPNMITSSPRVLHMTTRDGGQSTSQCDGTGVAPSTCNVKYVYDSSDFTRYKRQNAVNNGLARLGTTAVRGRGDNPNDSAGGANNGAQSALRFVRH